MQSGNTSQTYPSAPWHLHAQGLVSFWRLRREQFRYRLPPSIRPIRLAGSLIAAVALLEYDDRGELAYRELLFALWVRPARSTAVHEPCVHVPFIWVDSTASLAGGRELWAIPKELAQFDLEPGEATVRQPMEIARVRYEPTRFRLPGRLPARLCLAQQDAAGLRLTQLQARGRVGCARARWQFPSTSPLHFLDRIEASATLSVDQVDMRFGVSPST